MQASLWMVKDFFTQGSVGIIMSYVTHHVMFLSDLLSLLTILAI
jgi:hypothetical protein